MKRRLARIAAGFRDFHLRQRELLERQHLANRPWEEQYLHWSYDGTQWHLHGHLPPPSKRRCSTTRGGWCQASQSLPLGPPRNPS
jgi:hypothetical protein